jgi:alpha-L-fucosidase
VNTTEWFDLIMALGANIIAVLMAKHGCGFLLWPTNSTFDDGHPYEYHTSYDLLQDFANTAKSAGVGY